MAFGDFATDAESLGETVNNVATPLLKVRLTTPPVPAGDYRIGWSYTWGLSNIANDFQAIIEEDDTFIIYTHRQEPKDSATTQRNPGGGFGNRTLTAGVHTFDLEFQPITGGDEARIQQARVEFWSVS